MILPAINIATVIKLIADNMHTESTFLSPEPQATVDVITLLDALDEVSGIPLGTCGKVFNAYMDSKETKL